MSNSTPNLKDTDEISNHVIISAILLLPEIHEFYNSEKGMKFFAEWYIKHKIKFTCI